MLNCPLCVENSAPSLDLGSFYARLLQSLNEEKLKMFRYKDWIENKVQKQPMSKDKPWKTFRKPREQLLKSTFKETLASWQQNIKKRGVAQRISTVLFNSRPVK